ncbi:MAG: ribosome-recycling factor [Patescibacteria group bacterium]|nr:ribosome-recycling factor [Patescibacteria group bacterium]
MSSVIDDFRKRSTQAVENLKEDLKSIRTGRVNPSLLENISVETYGGSMTLKLKELATITIDTPDCLAVIPFDSTVLSDIEKALLKSPLGFSPSIQGSKILVKIPPLSTEQREKYRKLAGQKIEERKHQIRNLRDETRRQIKSLFEKKEISEDEKFRLEKELDQENHQLMKVIELIKDKKEKEILEI